MNMNLKNIFARKSMVTINQNQSAQRVTVFDIYGGGSGGAIGALKTVMAPGEALFAKLSGQARLSNPETCMVDMDAEAPGLERAAVTENRLNALASSDSEGTAFGYYRVRNASISAQMEGPRGEETSIRDMIDAGDRDSLRLMELVLTPEEASLSRKVGGQGKPKLVELWQSSVMKVETMQSIVDSIIKAYVNGSRVLVRVTGSATGATGATFLKTMPQEIYTRCFETNPALIDNLRIHTVVITGYAVHPGEAESGAFALDPTEDDLRTLHWFNERAASGVDRMINRTYFIYAKPAMCYEHFARGGDQGRHYSLGDFLCLAAIRDSDETAFDPSGDGCRVFIPTGDDDARFGWANISDEALKRQYVNYLRFCAAVWLKLRPLTLVSHQEARVAPHVVRMLGRDAPADKLEQEIIRPIQAMIGIAGDALEAFRDMGASGTDFSQNPITYTAEDTTIFNPYAIRSILSGTVADSEINDFSLDSLTEYQKGSGTANVIRTGDTVGGAYNAASSAVGRGDTAAQFLLELYRALAI